MSIYGVKVLPLPLRSIDSSTFNNTYLAIGIPLDHPACLIKFTNNSNKDALISWDGVTNHDIVPAGGFVLYDIETNSGSETRGLSVAQGTQFYVNGAAGTGLVYLTVLYIREN